MNYCLVISALIALVASLATANPLQPIEALDDVASELSLTPTNNEEVASLQGKTAAFSDYCITSRDYIIADVKAASNGMAAKLFNLFFNSAENLGLEVVNVQRDAANRLGNQIRHPDAPIAEMTGNDDVDSVIVDGQKKIQASTSQPKNLFQGVVSALAATKNAMTSQVLSKLDQLKASLDVNMIVGALRDACDRVAQYDRELMNRFVLTRDQLAEHDADLANIQLENVGCVTVRRIIRLDGICKFAMAAQNPLIKAITYKPITNN